MPDTHRCLQCGAELAPNVAQGLCPKCLLAAGLGAPTQTEGAETAASPPSGPSLKRGEPLPEPGRQFGGYRLVRHLGQGGMGAVYEAEHLESGRRVALKVLSHSLDSPAARARFLREGRLAASINHPNSVYIYGTEEIEGTPAISMELVAGGTLEDRVREKGPMPAGEAVDAILQIVEGLQAAQAVGVLHRDVKPSNCFVEAGGTVKVGDFGLSISTKGRSEADLTVTGTFMGTPAFASPEQLRGDELDVRSDIYAVGITLYYLLTGKTPFRAENLVRFIATALESPAESPAKFRPEIPKGLCATVLRCLEKQPAQRFRNYDELRQALVPFSSTAPTPATLGLRFLAACFDGLILGVLGLPVSLTIMGDMAWLHNPAARPGVFAFMLVGFAAWLLYFAISEGVWGASLGKAVCRLRVVGPSRSVPGVPRALLRVATFAVLPVLPTWIYFGFDPARMVTVGERPFSLDMWVAYSYYVFLALLFATARRRNGFAGLHDLASGTRVIRKAAYEARPVLQPEGRVPPVSEATPTLGPYYVLEPLAQRGTEELLLGYDMRLLRKVWIRRLPEGAPAVAAGIRSLGRATRLRWLGGRRAAGENWDAYEAPPGQPLWALRGRRQPWRSVRYWLLDLAEELRASLEEGSVPSPLGLDRVWITADGRAKLLDFPAPGIDEKRAASEPPALEAVDFQATRVFLNQVAVAALEGRMLDAQAARDQAVAVPLPLSARDLLRALPTLQDFGSLTSGLKSLLQKTASVSRLRRFGLVAVCAALPVIAAGGMIFGFFMMRQLGRTQPDIEPLRTCLFRMAMLGNPPPNDKAQQERQAFEIYIAGHFRKTISDPASWSSLYAKSMIPEPWHKTAEEIIATHPSPSQDELAEATAIVQPVLDEMAASGGPFPPILAAFVGIAWAGIIAILSLLCALVFRRGLALLLLGVDLVTRDGSRASRLRVFWRCLVVWAPLPAIPILMGWLLTVVAPSTRGEVMLGLASALTFALYIPLVACSTLLPERGLQDRLAGTWLVPR